LKLLLVPSSSRTRNHFQLCSRASGHDMNHTGAPQTKQSSHGVNSKSYPRPMQLIISASLETTVWESGVAYGKLQQQTGLVKLPLTWTRLDTSSLLKKWSYSQQPVQFNLLSPEEWQTSRVWVDEILKPAQRDSIFFPLLSDHTKRVAWAPLNVHLDIYCQQHRLEFQCHKGEESFKKMGHICDAIIIIIIYYIVYIRLYIYIKPNVCIKMYPL
jgi:hypothetical protein